MTMRRSGAGRPLKFLVLVLGAWTGVRTWQLWPDPPLPPSLREAARRVVGAVASVDAPVMATWEGPPVVADGSAAGRVRPVVERGGAAPASVFVRPPPALPAAMLPSTAAGAAGNAPGYVMALLGMVRYGAPEPPAAGRRRWSASAWAIMRGTGPGGGVATPQLGGGQAGLRIARTLDAQGRVAIAARAATALGTRQQEAAVGLEWRPTAMPVRIVAERRVGLAGTRGGTALGLVGGVGDVALPAGFRLDGYAQAGVVLRDHVEGYADGALRMARTVAGQDGGIRLSLGAGAWGAAQRGARRLDLGPAAVLEVPIGTVPRVRIALEWRQRVAGAARPGSGPALSIGADY